jgi:hypothetical protein
LNNGKRIVDVTLHGRNGACILSMKTDRQTDRKAGKETYRKTGRQTCMQTSTQASRHGVWQRDIHAYGMAGIQAD